MVAISRSKGYGLKFVAIIKEMEDLPGSADNYQPGRSESAWRYAAQRAANSFRKLHSELCEVTNDVTSPLPEVHFELAPATMSGFGAERRIDGDTEVTWEHFTDPRRDLHATRAGLTHIGDSDSDKASAWDGLELASSTSPKDGQVLMRSFSTHDQFSGAQKENTAQLRSQLVNLITDIQTRIIARAESQRNPLQQSPSANPTHQHFGLPTTGS